MTNLVDQLLTLARAENTPAELQPSQPLTEAAKKAITLAGLDQDPRLQTTITNNPTAKISPAHATQIITNLLTNSARHTPPEKTIHLTIASANNKTTITVQDSGEGIAAHHIPKLTERFYRTDSARSQQQGGTGLGLSIVASLVHQAQGQINIQSQPENGTTITITLPS